MPTVMNTAPLNDIDDLLYNEYFVSTETATIISTTSSYSSSVPWNDITAFVKVIYPLLYILLTAVLSLIGFCVRKWVLNGCRCKCSWFFPKRPSEYRRRRQTIRQREMALDQMAEHSSTLVYSIA